VKTELLNGLQEIVMQALAVNTQRKLELRDIAEPTSAPVGHLLVEIEFAAINHGDKTFLALPNLMSMPRRREDVWGASAAGRVIAVGAGAPERYLGRKVALYRSLSRTPETLGLWSQKAIVEPNACVILPDEVRARDYSGSLVNAITAYAFLDAARDEGHTGVIATLGPSGTGRALLALARARGVPALFLARSTAARAALLELGAEHALDTSAPGFEAEFAALSERLQATAVFDGVGGALIGRLAPLVAANSTFYLYGFLGGPTPIAIPSVLFMMKNLTLKRFSNFASPTATDPARLATALRDLEGLIGDPLFRTSIGREFGFAEIEAALAYEEPGGVKAVLVG
jgi:NADPH:quinone reductase